MKRKNSPSIHLKKNTQDNIMQLNWLLYKKRVLKASPQAYQNYKKAC
jgi:ribosomal protein S30